MLTNSDKTLLVSNYLAEVLDLEVYQKQMHRVATTLYLLGLRDSIVYLLDVTYSSKKSRDQVLLGVLLDSKFWQPPMDNFTAVRIIKWINKTFPVKI